MVRTLPRLVNRHLAKHDRNGDPATDAAKQATRHDIEDPTKGVSVEDLSTTDHILDWGDWVLDGDWNLVGYL